MAEAPQASTISPLNILFGQLESEMDHSDVKKMKNLLRGNQLSKVEMEKLESASDVFHHLKDRGDIGVQNLALLIELFEWIEREPLKKKVTEFQQKYSSDMKKTVKKLPKLNVSSDIKKKYRKRLHGGIVKRKRFGRQSLNAKTRVVIDEIEREDERREKVQLQLKEQKQRLEAIEKLQKLAEEHVEKMGKLIMEGGDQAAREQLSVIFKESRSVLEKIAFGCLLFVLSFLTADNIDYFWQKYNDGTIASALTCFLISPDIRLEAEKAGYTVRISMDVNQKQYTELRQELMLDMIWCDKWEEYVMSQVDDIDLASTLIEQSRSDPVLDILTQEEFFFPAMVSFWIENSNTLPATVTMATEYAVVHHAEMYCKENNIEVENLRELVKARFNDIGKCLYEHITEENVGKLNPSWIGESISNLESHLFGLLTKSEDLYSFQSKYVYSYMTAVYVSNTIALSPHNIPVLLREERMKTWQTYLPYCFPYISGILGDKASCFLNELATYRLMQTSVNIDSLEFIGSCLFESEMPSVFARDIEKLIGQNHTLDLSTCTGISNQSIHALSVLLQNTSLVKDIKLYTENDESSLSSDFKECLANIMSDPFTVDRCTVRINNCHDFNVIAKLLRVLPLLYKNAISESGSDTTLQPGVSSLTISSSVSIQEEIYTCAMKMFMKALSCMPHLEKLSLIGLGKELCEQFLVCLSEETVCVNINTLCLAENELSWEHSQLLLQALNAMPCLSSLDLSRNNIGSLGCTVLLPIKDEIDVRVDDDNIADGLLEILPLCTSTAQLQDVGDLTLKSLDDVASVITRLENP
ncbi:uncharacterized protein [Ptychodera flava]|uniref:uncharacterized protein n=1 Tax=Ptychodera flava TaxID=63121 RepID=UPI00396A7F11